MACPHLRDLPPPAPGKTGWPWTVESEPLPAMSPDGRRWPRISIVTPSYNQGQFVEEAIRSILLQGYPNLEYIVVDGGSTDGTVETIQKYEGWIHHWVSEPDRGQSHAINKGLALCTGEVFNWLNSDDGLMPEALGRVAGQWRTTDPDVLVGRGQVIEIESGKILHDWLPRPPTCVSDFLESGRVVMPQASTFLRAELVRRIGGLREDLECVMDWELYLRLVLRRGKRLNATVTPGVLSRALYHREAKSSVRASVFRREAVQVLGGVRRQLALIERWRLARCLGRIETQDAITGTLAASPAPMRGLLGLLLARPPTLASRFFWGAFRRAMWKRARA